MGKEKVIEKTTEEVAKRGNILLQYAPIILGLICLIICYLLFKKMQSLNSQSDSISKLEKQFTGFVKEQSEMNTVNGKKFNGMISQINQLGYIVQNSNVRESNSINGQMSPERINEKTQVQPVQQVQQVQPVQPVQQVQQVQPVQQVPQVPQVQQVQQDQQDVPDKHVSKQPKQREMMPTNVIQTNTPMNIEPEMNRLPPPINTSVKKEIQTSDDFIKPTNKKVINLQQDKEEVMIEEVSSDDEN